MASAAQLRYIEDLCEQLGYDSDDYITAGLTSKQASDIISNLKKEL